MTISLLKEKSTRSTSSFNLSNLNGSNGNTTPIVTSGVVFIDPKVDDYEMLMAGVKPGLEVVLLDGSHNGITQITHALNKHRGLSSLHIVAHGEAGSLWLGNGLVNSNTLDQQRDELHSWATALAPDADILLYGCNVAAGEKGQHFVQLLGQITGADVAASNNLTGSAALGGNWELEVKIGLVEAPIAFGAETVKDYNAVLTIRRVSVTSDGTEVNNNSEDASISADGRYVAFSSDASNLVSGDTNNASDIFVYDQQTNTTRRVSVGTGGTEGNNYSNSDDPSISADGRYVSFSSNASNLVSGDTNGTYDIFVHDQQTNTTRRVSVGTGGTEGNNGSLESSISANGRYVAFSSDASNLVSGDTNNTSDIFVYDQQTNTTRRVSIGNNGTEGNSLSGSPSISADGRYVVFSSDANNLVSGDTNNASDIFVYDTLANTTRRVSVGNNGTEGNNGSFAPSISADGRYVAFQSNANNLVSGDTNNASDIFVYDTLANTNRRVSVSTEGTQALSFSGSPSISADGRYVAFISDANNLVSGDTNDTSDLFLYDTLANTTRRVSVDPNVTQISNPDYNYSAFPPSISADGRYVAFEFGFIGIVEGFSSIDLSDILVYDANSGTENPWTGTPFNDTYIYTGTANFTGSGLAGNDTIVGNVGNDSLSGGDGNDSLTGGAGNDTLDGGNGDDLIYFGDGDDFLDITSLGNDTFYGGSGNDFIYGYTGNETYYGELGNDTLKGYFGNDTINGGAGADSLDGGADTDTLSYAGSSAGVSVNLATNTVSGGHATGDIISNFENVTGSSYDDALTGSSGNNTLDGGSGNDNLIGGAGNDTYYVDSTGDKIVENLNEGTDTVISSQQYQLGNNLENLTLTGTASRGIGNSLNNVITGNSQANYIVGQAGNDTIYGGAGNDNLNGNDGNDNLYGEVGNDTLVGERGSDLLSGGDGNDLLVGYGNSSGEIDTLVGGGGSDIFGVGVNVARFGAGSGGTIVGYTGDGNTGYALIQDWESTDKIELYGNINLYTFGVANMAGTSAADTTISYNGPNGADLIAVVQDSTNIPLSSLIFFT